MISKKMVKSNRYLYSTKNLRMDHRKQTFFQSLIYHLDKQFTLEEKEFFRLSVLNQKNKERSHHYSDHNKNYEEGNNKQSNYSPLAFIKQDVFRYQKSKKNLVNLHGAASLRNSEPSNIQIKEKSKKKPNLRKIIHNSIEKENEDLQKQSLSLNKTCHLNRKKKFMHITSNKMFQREKRETQKILRFNKSKKVYKMSFLDKILDSSNNTTLNNFHQRKEQQPNDPDFTDRLFKKYDLNSKYQMINSCKINKSPKKSPRRYTFGNKSVSRKY